MQLSYRILKSTIVEKDKLVFPPVIEKIIGNSHSSEANNFNFGEIYERIIKEANDVKSQIIKGAEEKAKEIINTALQEVENIKASAKDEGYQCGFRKGYEEGYSYGLNEAKNEVDAMVKDAEDYVKKCHEASRKYIEETKDEIIGLSVQIARKILNTELTVNTEAIYKMAESIISKAIDKRQIVLKVNPQDFNIVKNRKDDLSIYVEDPNNLIIIADSSLRQGSIKAETPSGFIDGDIDTQLEIILKNLLEGKYHD
ncbi:FliH/SctL family protein [Fonticella tunisiensis]|uniref:Flagellar biosynthesis/type III secretory pathway protein FliH n=1 Tax=Fonticella tunisiensis TaxID=1096341 RepID=A0A4R7KAZ9_9CLOT|nr:FliH/SctL family protein [Fonticella tunisiensis]TDT50610.1 flagellar biosynthesis/type III secretory pathway protein FliH [Fonticella tunisiensis]